MTEINASPGSRGVGSSPQDDRSPAGVPSPTTSSSRTVLDYTGRASAGFALVAILWICVGLALATALIGRILGYSILGDSVQNFVTYSGPFGAGAIIFVTTAAAMVTRWLRPQSVLSTVLAVSALLYLAATVATGRLVALVAACCIIAMATLLGHICLVAFALPAQGLTGLVIASATGLGLFGLVGFLLGIIGALNVIGVGACVVLVLIAAALLWRTKHIHPLAWARLGNKTNLTWLESFCVGVLVGLAVFSSMSALVPEVMFDPFRQHLPVAEAIWRSHSIAVIPNLGVSRDPVLGHLLFAVAFGFGDTNAAILLNMLIGIGSIAGVAVAANQLAGRTSVVVSIAAYVGMPLVLWELGHAYTDMFPAFFTLVSLLCILRWQQDDQHGWLFLAGLASASAFAAKLTAIWIVVPLAIGVLIIGRRSWNTRERVVTTLWFAVGALAALPWLIRTLVVFGGLPAKLALFLESAFSLIPGVHIAIQQKVEPGFNPIVGEVGIGHGWLDILRVPFLIAFASDKFPDQAIGGGDLGLVLPLLVPFVLLAPRTRGSALIAMSIGVSYLGWWFSPLQATRHLLPTLAFLVLLIGSGVANVTISARRQQKILTLVSRFALALGVILSPILLVTGRMSQVPFDVIIGRVSAAEYVTREIPAAVELAEASALLPPQAPLLYIGKWGGAQLYTTAPLINAGQLTQESLDEQFGQEDGEVRTKLQDLGVTAFVWDRPTTKPEDSTSRLLSLEFLSKNTRVVQISNGYILFSIVPDARDFWNVDPDSTLVMDPEFNSIKRTNSPWSSDERITRSNGTIAPRRQSFVQQSIRVEPGARYLLVANVACPDLWSRTTLSLRWLSEDGAEISQDSQTVFPGTELNDQFMWATAPEGAISVTVGFGGQSRCDFARVDVFEQPI